MVGAVVFAMVWVLGASGASAAPTGCASAPSYGVGVAIIPEFVGTDDVAVTAYVGEVIDYDVTVFLRQDPPGTPNGVVVCPIFGGTLTITLPDGSGPFTIATGISLPVGGSVVFENVPSQKYTMSAADVVTAPGCVPGAPCFDRVQATAHVEATSDGPDDGPTDDDAGPSDGDCTHLSAGAFVAADLDSKFAGDQRRRVDRVDRDGDERHAGALPPDGAQRRARRPVD